MEMRTAKKRLRGIFAWLYKTKLLHPFVPHSVWEKMDVIDPLIWLLKKKEFHKIAITTNKRDSRVLFLRMRFVPRMIAAELVLANRLSDNAECVFVFCSPILSICNGWDIRNQVPRKVCEYCYRNNRELCRLSPFRSVFIEKFVSDSEREEAELEYDSVSISDLKNMEFEGVSVKNELYLSLAKFLFCGTIPETDTNKELARDFAVSGAIVAKGLRRIIEQEKPDIVVMNAGHIFWYGIAYNLLNTLGIPMVTYDETNIDTTKSRWIFDNGAPCIDLDWDDEWERRKGFPLRSMAEDEINHLIVHRRKFYLYKKDTETIPVSKKCDLSGYRKKFALFTNVLWDATVVQKDDIFENMLDWIKTTVDYIQLQKDCCLVIRVHPAEAGVYGMISRERVIEQLRRWKNCFGNNIFFVDAKLKVNSYDIIENSDAVLVYCSNIGLEAVFYDKMVIVCGKAHYRNKGFTVDPTSEEEYEKLLRNVCEDDFYQKPDVELAKRYAHLAFIDTQIDLGIFIDEHPFRVSDLAFSDFKKQKQACNESIMKLSEWFLQTPKTRERGPFVNSYTQNQNQT